VLRHSPKPFKNVVLHISIAQEKNTISRSYSQPLLDESRSHVSDLSTGENLALVTDSDFTPQAEFVAK
jgi:hypothetical protein